MEFQPKILLWHLVIYTKGWFAQKYGEWSAEDWECIIWMDESTFEIGKNSRQVCVWRTANERYSSNCIVPSFRSRRTSLMIWGAFVGGQKSILVCMLKDQCFAKDIVEVDYEGELFHFMVNVPNAMFMDTAHPSIVAKYVKNGDNNAFSKISNGLQTLPISIQLRTCGWF